MNIKHLSFVCIALFCFFNTAFAQNGVKIEGFTFEEDNRGYVSRVKVTLIDSLTNKTIESVITDREGKFAFSASRGKRYKITADRREFETARIGVSTFGLKDQNKVFAKVKMVRKPGYIFDVTIAETRSGRDVVNAIDSARIEIFNNTAGTEDLVLEKYPYPNFQFTFIPGNHYTIMIRRKNYFNKRIEAFVNVDGCILCFDGLGTVEPGVTDIMAHGNEKGTFLANVELEPIVLNKSYAVENIYYDYDKWDIRPDAAVELNKLIVLLKDNPAVTIELGSHTDSRGNDDYNMLLSEKRAASAVDYLIAEGGIDPGKLFGRGYGESQLINHCTNGVKCSKAEHQQNRRTALKIVGIMEEDPLDNKSLKEILLEERLLQEVMNQEVIKFEDGNE